MKDVNDVLKRGNIQDLVDLLDNPVAKWDFPNFGPEVISDVEVYELDNGCIWIGFQLDENYFMIEEGREENPDTMHLQADFSISPMDLPNMKLFLTLSIFDMDHFEYTLYSQNGYYILMPLAFLPK